MTESPLSALLFPRFADIIDRPREMPTATVLGESREGRDLHGFTIGTGPRRVSVIGGCHADEPVGPRFLRQLVSWLHGLPADDPAVGDIEWWIVPHANPDGEQRNLAWYGDDDQAYDFTRYGTHVIREAPFEDVEFGFPRDADDTDARPENRALWHWWQPTKADSGFALHVTLHGMAIGAGPWFLLEREWIDRSAGLQQTVADEVRAMGYVLHDIERSGEKGFDRIAKGFCTRPDSQAMVRHFQALGDPETASVFRPTSMETIRAISRDALTLVSEMPLFLTPGVGETLGPPDPVADDWKQRINDAQLALSTGDNCANSLVDDLKERGLRPMPIRDQMRLQWRFITAGLDLSARGRHA